MGGAKRAFFRRIPDVRRKRRLDSQAEKPKRLGTEVATEVIAELIDRFAASYGWTSGYTVQHTLFQLNQLGERMVWRVYRDRVIRLNIYKTARDASRIEYERYVESLKPSTKVLPGVSRRRRSAYAERVVIPPSMTFKKV